MLIGKSLGGWDVSPTIIAAQHKGPSGTNDGTIVVVRKDKEQSSHRWCKSVSGTLAYRDGYKTGPSTPNGQDVNGKLVVW